MIVAFGGRIGSGKSSLSSNFNNFKKIAFADFLKKAVSQTFNFDIRYLYDQKSKAEILGTPIIWNESVASKLFNFCNINPNFEIENKEFHTRRELIQYIGTDILRRYDNDFHIKKTIENLNLKHNYVCEDVRFKNELQALKNIGSINYFVIRPNNQSKSNHSSETELSWTDFDSVIINNKPVDKFFKTKLEIESYSDFDLRFSGQTKEECFFAGFALSSGWLVKINRYKEIFAIVSKNHSMMKQLKDFIGSEDKIEKFNKEYSFQITSPFIIENLKSFSQSLPAKRRSLVSGTLSMLPIHLAD